MKTIVVLPTYNEKETIQEVLRGILTHDVEVLVVDDSSPDGTGKIVAELQKQNARIHLLSGRKKGLGDAYRRGFAYATQHLNADILMEMDADLSHNPKDIPRLLKPILQQEADFVIGSRYCPGGSIEGWGRYRKSVSYCGNLLARIIGGIREIKDTTAGFRALRAEIVQDWDASATKGYSFQIGLLHHALQNKYRVQEIPVRFTDRKVGKSKLGMTDILEFFFVALRIGFQTYRRILIFLLIGFTGLLINIGAQSIFLRLLHIQSLIALALAIEVSILWNFFWHDNMTFADRKRGNILYRGVKYHITSILGAGINFILAATLILHFAFIDELANLIGIGVATISNFLLSYYWAWKK